VKFPSFLFKNSWNHIKWIFLTLVCLLFFTFFKLPQDQINRWLDFSLKKQMEPYGLSFRAEESYLSYMLGLSYTLKNVNFFSEASYAQTDDLSHFDKIQIVPKIMSLFLGNKGINLTLLESQGSLKTEFSANSKNFDIIYQAKHFDLQKTGLLALFLGIQVKGFLEGKGRLSGSLQDMSSFKGSCHLKIQQASLESQIFLGLSLPAILLSEIKLGLLFEKETLLLQEVQVGNATDSDVRGTVSGNIKLGKTWNTSSLQTTVKVNFSEKFMKSFFFLSALLANGKQEDGSYAFSITGPVSSASLAPLKES
jgi:type II secretion system protein N